MLSLLDFVIPVAHAQGAGGGKSGEDPLLSLLFPILLVAVFYFLLIRPQMKRNKEQRQMMEKMAKGDEVVTNGGLAGKIVAIGEAYVTVEVADKVEVKLQKSAVVGILPKGTLKSL